jgi:hypothetical protein
MDGVSVFSGVMVTVGDSVGLGVCVLVGVGLIVLVDVFGGIGDFDG